MYVVNTQAVPYGITFLSYTDNLARNVESEKRNQVH